MADGGPLFVDTWGWLALGHRRDSHHAAVLQLFQQLQGHQVRLYTSDLVLDELITLLFRREVFAEAVRFTEGILSASPARLRVERATPERFAATWALRKRFQDKPLISFTDLLSMAIMEERGIRRVLTDDNHFTHFGMGFTKFP